MRRSYAIAFVVTSLLCPLVLAPAAQAAPDYVRLSYPSAKTDSEMGIAWNTTDQVGTHVQWGTAPGQLTSDATGISILGNGTIGYIHEVTISGLQPDTTYYYRVGDPVDGYSPEYTFTTGPRQDPDCGSFRFIFLADNRPDATFGGGDNYEAILGEAYAKSPDFVLTGGDMVLSGNDSAEWLQFLGYGVGTSPVTPYVPVMPSMGNHDNGPGAGPGAYYNQIFHLPVSTGTGASNTEDFYYFTYANAIFVALNTEEFTGGTRPFGDQAAWLDEVLTQNPRKWKVVYLHKPPYTYELSLGNHPPNEENQNAALVPVFDAHHVDLVLSSHNHWYERYEPSACANQGNPGSDDPCPVGSTNFSSGTVYIVSGGAGAFTIPFCTDINPLNPPPAGRVACSGDHHFVMFDIANETLTMETWAAAPQSPSIIDTITITKPVTGNCATTTNPDAGVPDAGGPQDAGGNDAASGADGGPQPDGAVTTSDSGTQRPPAVAKKGCQCSAPGGGDVPPLVALLLIVAIMLRRRRSRA